MYLFVVSFPNNARRRAPNISGESHRGIVHVPNKGCFPTLCNKTIAFCVCNRVLLVVL